MNSVSLFHQAEFVLGEALYIDSDALYWLDIAQHLLMRKAFCGQFTQFTLPYQASAIWKVERNVVYLIGADGLCTFNLVSNKWLLVAEIPSRDEGGLLRSNDGGQFSENIYLFGTMQKQPDSLVGSLYWTDGTSVFSIYSGIGIPNTFVKIGKNEVLISDSLMKVVYKFHFDVDSKSFIDKQVWLDLSVCEYTPDGGCVDENGNVYIAMWDGGCVHKYSSNAELLNRYYVPAQRPTNCILAQGGDVLYVTTAREDLTESNLSKYPDSGSVFEINLIG